MKNDRLRKATASVNRTEPTKEIQMNANLPLKSPFSAVAIALLLGTVNCVAADGISERFDRTLAH